MLRVLHWPLKSFGNFSITAIGIVGLGFWTYSFYSESKFNQPIIAESIKLLGKHPQIKELAGYPLSYSFSLSNRFVEKQGQNYFSFSVKGPKTSTNVQMTTTTLPAGEVYNYGSKSEKISKLEDQVKKQEEQVKSLQAQISKVNGKKQKDLQLQKIAHNNKLKALQDQLVEAKYEQLERKHKYFVPSKQTYTLASNPKSKDSNSPLAKDQLLWGINDLVITLPNRTKMIVLPEPKKSLTQKYAALKGNDLPDTPTLGLVYKQVSIDISEFSKEQVQEYGKQKISFMYSRYGSYRLFTFVLFIGAVVGLITYKRNNVLHSIKGSILEMEARKKLTQNPQLVKFMKNQAKQLELEAIVGGGQVGNQFDIVLYLKNLKNGKVQIKGSYFPQLNTYQFTKMQLRYKDKQEYKAVDLLI